MSISEIITRQVELLPKGKQAEVLDFVEYLLNKKTKKTSGKSKRKPGLAKGLIRMEEDFDEPLDDFKEYV